MDEQLRPPCKNLLRFMGFPRRGVTHPRIVLGSQRKGAARRTSCTAVAQCSGVCEAIALATRSGGQSSQQRSAVDRCVVGAVVLWYFSCTPLRLVLE